MRKRGHNWQENARLLLAIFGEQKFTDEQLRNVGRVIEHYGRIIDMMADEKEDAKKTSYEAGQEEGFDRGYKAGFEDGEGKGYSKGFDSANMYSERLKNVRAVQKN